jgi:APA family basic amino acid/polyamine antiporter
LFLVTGINLMGVRSAGRIEFVFTLLKLLPLVLVPAAGIFYFNGAHFVPFNPTGESTISVLNAAAILTLWGFIGVECATTPADAVENPKKTIPRAQVHCSLLSSILSVASLSWAWCHQKALLHLKHPLQMPLPSSLAATGI